jgi:isopentenyl-diphosphate Delta-isomerase
MIDAHKVVSSESEELILVDADDNETGYLSKAASHDGDGVLHRAFSIFLFNAEGELLLQQRSPSKRLWPEYWSNSICSHPRRGESMEIATERRLRDELNIHCDLEFVYKFAYQEAFGDVGSENELCHVFLGRCSAEILPNEHEIAAIRFVSTSGLDREFAEKPETLTPWFKLEWGMLSRDYREQLAKYAVRRL